MMDSNMKFIRQPGEEVLVRSSGLKSVYYCRHKIPEFVILGQVCVTATILNRNLFLSGVCTCVRTFFNVKLKILKESGYRSKYDF